MVAAAAKCNVLYFVEKVKAVLPRRKNEVVYMSEPISFVYA